MKIESVEKIVTIYELVDFIDKDYTYERYSPNCWSVRIGESIETIYSCEELEKAYQEYHANKL